MKATKSDAKGVRAIPPAREVEGALGGQNCPPSISGGIDLPTAFATVKTGAGDDAFGGIHGEFGAEIFFGTATTQST